MSGSTHGKQFEKDLLTSIRSMGHWAERFRDNTWNNMAGSNASPPDMIAIINGRPTLIECKAISVGMNQSTKRPRDLMQGGISLKRCEGHQLERLINFVEEGHGNAYIAVMFYTPRAVRRCVVLVPVAAWVGARDLYGSGTLRLDRIRQDLPASLHMKWVGRKSDIGPYDICTELGYSPELDITIGDKTHGR